MKSAKQLATNRSGSKLAIVRVGGRYRVKKKIGCGSFGTVYLGVHIHSQQEVAIKVEPLHIKQSQLEHEFHVYKTFNGSVGIPKVQWFGMECDHNVMVLELLGPSLEDLFDLHNHNFSLKTVLLLADQMIALIERIHSDNFIHRDLKPANFLMGVGQHANQVYIIDFGLAQTYRAASTHLHTPRTENHPLVGTAPFSSINSHLGFNQSRRDDLESLIYVLIYFMRGSLPWYNKAVTRKKSRTQILSEKRASLGSPSRLLHGCPDEFGIFLHYIRNLHFNDKPDYSYLRNLFADLLVREGHQYDCDFDWSVQQDVGSKAQAVAKETAGCAGNGGNRMLRPRRQLATAGKE